MSTSGASLKKVPGLWFEDGNVIIISGDRAFRVYEGIITSRSPVLRDMFNTSQFSAATNSDISPNVETALKPFPVTSATLSMQDGADRIVIDGAEQVYSSLGVTGCPIVRMTDRPDDVKGFLSAFLGNSQQYSRNLAALAGILRLSTKYKVDFLQRWAVTCLERLLPVGQKGVIEDMRTKGTTGWLNGLFPLIDVAITGDMLWILPDVYWNLRQARLADILNHPEWKELSDERRTAFLVAREASWVVVVNDFAAMLRVQRENSTSPEHARHPYCFDQFRHNTIRILLEAGPHGTDNTDDNASVWAAYWDESACDLCKEGYRAQRKQMMKDNFTAIQKHFGLPDRKRLDEMRITYHQADHL